MANILIIDDDIAVREYLATLVTRLNHTPFQAATCADGVFQMANLITGEPSEELASKAQGGEIMAFLTKPFELAFIKSLLAQATGTASTPSAPR